MTVILAAALAVATVRAFRRASRVLDQAQQLVGRP